MLIEWKGKGGGEVRVARARRGSAGRVGGGNGLRGGGGVAAARTVYPWRLRQPECIRLPLSCICYPVGQVFLCVNQ